MNSTLSHTENQAQVQKRPINPGFSLTFEGIWAIPTSDNIEMLLRALSKTERTIYNAFIYIQNIKKTVFVSRDYIARRTGLSIKTVQRTLTILKHLGLIKSFGRFMTTSIYKFPQAFQDWNIRNSLACFLPALRCMFLGLLLSQNQNVQKPDQDRNVPLYTNLIFKNLSYLILSYSNESDCMFKEADAFVSEYVRTLTTKLKLTKWGQIKLSVFPDDVLQEAYDKTGDKTGLSDPYAFLVKNCTMICDQRGIKPNWKRMYDLYRELKKPDNAPEHFPFEHLNGELRKPLYKALSDSSAIEPSACRKRTVNLQLQENEFETTERYWKIKSMENSLTYADAKSRPFTQGYLNEHIAIYNHNMPEAPYNPNEDLRYSIHQKTKRY